MSNPTSPLDLGTLPVSKLLKQYAFPGHRRHDGIVALQHGG